MIFERAREVADAVLYEGYALYPYRASSAKNRVRWQFGVLAPKAWSVAGGCEAWQSRTECLVEAGPEFAVTGKLRFLQATRRTIEAVAPDARGTFRPALALDVDGTLWLPWEEGTLREVDFEALLGEGAAESAGVAFAIPGAHSMEPILAGTRRVVGRCVHVATPLAGVVRVSAERVGEGLYRLRVLVENLTAWDEADAPRAAVVSASLLGAHTLLAVRGGKFLSMTDPAPHAREAARGCRNQGTWPVLVGAVEARDEMLSSPIVLYDYPEIAPESPGDLFDSTEIDEILTLRTMTLTDAEKREARATDARAGAIIDRADGMTPDALARLHGTWSRRSQDGHVTIGGVSVAKGSRVRILPSARRLRAMRCEWEMLGRACA